MRWGFACRGEIAVRGKGDAPQRGDQALLAGERAILHIGKARLCLQQQDTQRGERDWLAALAGSWGKAQRRREVGA